MEDQITQAKAFLSKENADGNPQKEPKPYIPHCSHSRFTRIDRTKFKDRIEFLKECRRCGLQRVFVTRRDFNSSNVYVKTEWYDVPKRRMDPADE
jgi:hypothetical protein